MLSDTITLTSKGDSMGDKSPKSKDKAQKQKNIVKAKAVQKAQAEKDAKSFPGKPKS